MQQNIQALEPQLQTCTTQLQELLREVKQRIWSEEEIDFIQIITNFCTVAIAQIKLPEKLGTLTELRREDVDTNLGLNQQLEEKTSLLHTVVNSTPDGLYLVDRSRRFIYVNQTILQLLRREELDVLGKTGEELGILPETMIPHNARLESVFTKGEPLTEEISYVHSQTGSKHYALYNLTPIFRGDGQVEKVLVTHRDITELKLTEAALYKSNERFAKAFHGNPIASSISTYPEAKFIDVNTSWLQVFGYSREDVIGRTTLELGIWHSLEERAITIQQLQQAGTLHNCELRFCRKSGEVRNGLVNMELIELNGECSILAMLIDITERKCAEAAIKESEQKYRNIVETCQGIIWTVDLQGRITFVNQAVKQMYGYEIHEMIGRHFSEFMTSNQSQITQEIFIRVLEGESLFQHEAQFLHKEGRTLYISSNLMALQDDTGKVLGATGTTLDITPFKQTEAALRASQAKLSTILDSAIAVIINFRVFADQTWEYNYFSSGAEIMYGYTPEELIADKNLWLSRVFSEDVDMLLTVGFKNIFAEDRTHIEYRFRHKNGTVEWHSFTLFSKRDEAANCWVVTTVDTNINERKLVEERLKVSVQEKEALLKEVHHRVKNNLQVISSLLDFQAQHIQEPQAIKSFQASQNRVKSIALIHEKLYQSERFAQVNLADYIYSLTTHLVHAYTLNPDNISLQFQLDEVLCNLDVALPCGLLINELVSNALKHGLPGNAKGKIWVELKLLVIDAEFNSPQFCLIVGNDGIKLSELPSVDSLKSVGFQLIYALIQQLHGQIEIEQSRGTEFKIRFVNP